MKDEIKEILEDFKIYEDRYKKCNETQFIIFYRDIHLLLDYITNLQEEIKSLKGSCKALGKKCENQRKELIVLSHNLSKKNVKVQTLKTNMKELQQENERLKEENKRIFSKVNDDELLISNAMNYAEARDYKSRCEKAIEELDKYINSCEIEVEHTLNNEKCLISVRHSKKVKNILQGSDKE